MEGLTEVTIAFCHAYTFFLHTKADVTLFEIFMPNNSLVFTFFLIIDPHELGQRAFLREHMNEER